MKPLTSCIFFLVSALCWGQSGFTIPLAKANSALALPSMAEHDGVVYVVYRSFDLLRFSNKLQVIAYDLTRTRNFGTLQSPFRRSTEREHRKGYSSQKTGKLSPMRSCTNQA
jgi:hypothetical protein